MFLFLHDVCARFKKNKNKFQFFCNREIYSFIFIPYAFGSLRIRRSLNRKYML